LTLLTPVDEVEQLVNDQSYISLEEAKDALDLTDTLSDESEEGR